MTIESAIALLGTAEPWRAVPEDEFAGHVMGLPAPDWPWFVLNRQETIQFRMRGETTDAVILRPDTITDFDTLRQQLDALGFALEQKVTAAPSSASAPQSWFRKVLSVVFERSEFVHPSFKQVTYISFRHKNVRVQVPDLVLNDPGFESAVTVEIIR